MYLAKIHIPICVNAAKQETKRYVILQRVTIYYSKKWKKNLREKSGKLTPSSVLGSDFVRANTAY